MLDNLLVKTPGVCGGRIRIDGIRVIVHRIAVLYKQGQNAEEIARTYPHRSLCQVDKALAYYHANRDEVDVELAADEAECDALKSQPSRGIVMSAVRPYLDGGVSESVAIAGLRTRGVQILTTAAGDGHRQGHRGSPARA